MPTKQFNDFIKEPKDLCSKSFSVPGAWKVEGKVKAADKTPTINPGADAKGIFLEAEYNDKKYSLKSKTKIGADGTFKPKVTYDVAAGHKVDFTLNKPLKDVTDFEAKYEGEFACKAAVEEVVTKDSLSSAVSYPVGAVTLGASACVGFAKLGLKNWSAGVRFADKGYVASIIATGNASSVAAYTTGVFAPVQIGDYKFKVGGKVLCGSGKFNHAVGVEVPVCCFTVKAKLEDANVFSVAVVKKFASQWTAAVSTSFSGVPSELPKFGLQLTRE